MPMITGSVASAVTAQDDIFVEGAPNFYYQNNDGVNELNNPDDEGFYWNLSGTAANPIYQLGCYEDVRFSDSIEINAVRCDTVGDKDVLQKRTHLELTFTLKSLFPLTTITAILRGGVVTTDLVDHTEKMGLGIIDNADTYFVYLPKVYDEIEGDFVSITGHRCKFVDAWEMSMSFAAPWSIGITVWMLADDTKPNDQQFATIVRFDLGALV